MYRLLMCAPEAYALKYEINPWMSLRNPPDLKLAARQWEALHQALLAAGAEIEIVRQIPAGPDMVFTANAGLVAGGRALLSRFRHPQRQVEAPAFRAWFESQGYEVIEPPDDIHFEGEGDALYAGDVIVAGYLKRSDIAAHRWVAETLQTEVLSVEMTDPRWYHLDTAFVPLAPGLVAYYPGAFDAYGRDVIEGHFEAITVERNEALHFACNSVVLGRNVIMPAGCPRFAEELERRGFSVSSLDLSEFLKAGGAAKCLTLFLER